MMNNDDRKTSPITGKRGTPGTQGKGNNYAPPPAPVTRRLYGCPMHVHCDALEGEAHTGKGKS